MDFYAAVFIGVDLFTAGTDHDGGLRPLNYGLGRQALWTEGHGKGNTGEVVGVSFMVTVSRAGITVPHGGGMRDFGQQVIAVLIAT